MVSLMDASWMRLLMNENLMVIGLSWDYLLIANQYEINGFFFKLLEIFLARGLDGWPPEIETFHWHLHSLSSNGGQDI